MFFFFFKQKTAYEIRKGDWSSDVCSSDLGAYALDERIFEEIDRLAKDGKHDLPSAVSALAQRTPVLAIRTEGTWVDALYPWDLLRLNATALNGTHEVRSGTIEPAVTIRGRVSIGAGPDH